MMNATIKRILDGMVRPTIWPVGLNIWILRFVLMKLTVARFVLDRATERGELRPGQPVIESTSGTMGLALAYVCAERGHPLTLVSDPVVDDGLRQKLTMFRVRLHVVSSTGGRGNFQQARLDRLHEIRDDSGAFYTMQYDNPDAIDSYQEAAETALGAIGSINWIVSPTGSGASATGLARHVERLQGKPVRLAAVDTFGSVLFGQEDAPRRFRGLGNSIVPRNLDHTLVDEVHWMTAAPASDSANRLFAHHALDVGPTSGAAFLVAEDVATRYPGEHVLFVAPDTGERYRTTFLNRQWLRDEGLLSRAGPNRPVRVSRPSNATPPWAAMRWNRQRLNEIAAVQQRRAS